MYQCQNVTAQPVRYPQSTCSNLSLRIPPQVGHSLQPSNFTQISSPMCQVKIDATDSTAQVMLRDSDSEGEDEDKDKDSWMMTVMVGVVPTYFTERSRTDVFVTRQLLVLLP
jgi:hypothetical protein